MAEPRFTIDLEPEDDIWHATVYDLADHGPGMPYAECWGVLERVLHEASHYVLVASTDALHCKQENKGETT